MRVINKQDDVNVWVYYYGIELNVPNQGFICTGIDGMVKWYSEVPVRTGVYWFSNTFKKDLMNVDLEGEDWKKTCRSVSELVAEWEDEQ